MPLNFVLDKGRGLTCCKKNVSTSLWRKHFNVVPYSDITLFFNFCASFLLLFKIGVPDLLKTLRLKFYFDKKCMRMTVIHDVINLLQRITWHCYTSFPYCQHIYLYLLANLIGPTSCKFLKYDAQMIGLGLVRPKKNICLFKLSCQNKIGSVGRKIFLFFKIFF